MYSVRLVIYDDHDAIVGQVVQDVCLRRFVPGDRGGATVDEGREKGRVGRKVEDGGGEKRRMREEEVREEGVGESEAGEERARWGREWGGRRGSRR